MQRLPIKTRRDWQSKVERLGLTFHTPEGRLYWDESACYRFRSREVDELEFATEELQRLCLKAGQFIIDNERFDRFQIPPAARQPIRDAWEKEPPSIYGRFDLMYNGDSPPKLLEYNANTPTSLLEASVIQWYWHLDEKPGSDQFNSIHEKPIVKWKDIQPYLKSSYLHFTAMDNAEDLATITYLRDTAEQGGIKTSALATGQIGPLLEACAAMIWMEPIWKMMWSNKALLAVLWELFPGHPNLLEAHLDGPHGLKEFVKKPLLSREGANSTLRAWSGEVSTPGPYGQGADGEEAYVYQSLAPAGSFDGMRPVLGSWYITDQGPAGVGIRESDGPITDNRSRFVPHYFD